MFIFIRFYLIEFSDYVESTNPVLKKTINRDFESVQIPVGINFDLVQYAKETFWLWSTCEVLYIFELFFFWIAVSRFIITCSKLTLVDFQRLQRTTGEGYLIMVEHGQQTDEFHLKGTHVRKCSTRATPARPTSGRSFFRQKQGELLYLSGIILITNGAVCEGISIIQIRWALLLLGLQLLGLKVLDQNWAKFNDIFSLKLGTTLLMNWSAKYLYWDEMKVKGYLTK